VLDLHPLDEARTLLQRAGLRAVVQEVQIAALDLGVVPVNVSVHLPEGSREIVGVDLHAAPSVAAGRPQALNDAVEFEPPRYAASADTPMPRLLAFSIRETPGYTFTPYVVLDGEKARGAPVTVSAADAGGRDPRDLSLFPHDFPVGFVPVRASDELLALADVTVAPSWQHRHAPPPPFELAAARPARTLAIPRGARDVSITITARRRARPSTLTLGPLPPAPRYLLDLWSFPGYGPHAAELVWSFAAGEPPAVIELVPDGDGDEERTLERFEPGRPRVTYEWFARSPFTPGFKARLLGATTWSGPYPAVGSLPLSRAALQAALPLEEPC
jgi:hypothetical protein